MSESKVKLNFLYIILFFEFTQGFWERYTPIPAQAFLELSIIGITLLSYKSILNPLCYKLLFVLSIGLISSLYTSTPIAYIKSIRFVLYFFLLYDIYRNTHFEINQYLKLLRFLTGLILLQGVASIIQVFIIGKRVEGYVGYMSSLGGSTATTFLVIILAIGMVIILYANKQFPRKYVYWIILCMISAMLVGYSSGKRAIYFISPAIIAISIVLTRLNISKERLRELRKKIRMIGVLIILLFPIYMIGITTSNFHLSNKLKHNSSNIEVLSATIDYAMYYESSEHNSSSTGRSGTTENVLKSTISNAEYFLFGSGFGSNKNDKSTKERNIMYGFVGFSRDVFTGGIIFAILLSFWFVKLIFHHENIENDSFSVTLRYMILLAFLFTHFTYSADYITHLKLTSLLIVLLPIINSNKYVHIKEYLLGYLK